jgi:hypothetical protein
MLPLCLYPPNASGALRELWLEWNSTPLQPPPRQSVTMRYCMFQVYKICQRILHCCLPTCSIHKNIFQIHFKIVYMISFFSTIAPIARHLFAHTISYLPYSTYLCHPLVLAITMSIKWRKQPLLSTLIIVGEIHILII